MSVFAGDNPGARIEKIMSLSQQEFELSFARAVDDNALGLVETDDGTARYEVPLQGGRAVVTVEALEPLIMGGLVKLPRCQVVIDFADAPLRDRREFINKFDKAFQRGGG